MVKRKIVMVVRVCLEGITKVQKLNYDEQIMQHLADLQTKYPNLEWDFNLYGIQFTTNVCFRGYECY